MSTQFEIPSLEARMAAHAQEQNQILEKRVKSWYNALREGLPLQRGETVWFRVFWGCANCKKLSDEVLNETARMYREKGYFVRPLYSGRTFDWDQDYTVFEMAELDSANPRHTKPGRLSLFERIVCRLQFRLEISHHGRRYHPY